MNHDLVPISFDKIIQNRAYTAIILKEDSRRFAIFSEPYVGQFLHMHMANEPRKRPLSHDLMSMVFQAFDITVKQVVITDVQDTLFFAKLFLEMKKDGIAHIAEIDARPSDAIILAFLHKAPVFSTQEVVSKVVPFVE